MNEDETVESVFCDHSEKFGWRYISFEYRHRLQHRFRSQKIYEYMAIVTRQPSESQRFINMKSSSEMPIGIIILISDSARQDHF